MFEVLNSTSSSSNGTIDLAAICAEQQPGSGKSLQLRLGGKHWCIKPGAGWP
jgi:hypothetical protein